jgi:sugar lactone lactonase YvrE
MKWRQKSVITGFVMSGNTPIQASEVTLYSTGNRNGKRVLGKARTNRNGSFKIFYRTPENQDSILYLTTKSGRLSKTRNKLSRHFSLAVVIGPAPYAETVILNERTTVASGFAMAQFLHDSHLHGKGAGLQVASLMVRHLVDIETGKLGATITNDANGPPSLTLNTFNEMANLLATCAVDADTCRAITGLALPLNDKEPEDTFQAIANMATTPWRNPVPLFDLVGVDIYQPDLDDTPPSAWVLALKFLGDPRPFAGPGNIAVDRNGQLWVGNNYVHEEGFILPDCAGDLLYEMDPTTGLVNTYTGGGVDGVGFGITIAPNDDIWVGNFGFKGETCPRNPSSDSVSQFTSEGVPLSPDGVIIDGMYIEGGGWTNGGIGWPQGTVSNRRGDIWIASCNGEVIDNEQVDVTIYRDGNPDSWFVIKQPDLIKPFDVAFDTHGIAWVTGTNSDNVFAFRPDGAQISASPFALEPGSRPLGAASDSRGNVWVALSGLLEFPCPDLVNPVPPNETPAVLMFNPSGQQARSSSVTGNNATHPGGLTVPWGIAVDGADNVWVANFAGKRLSSFCGADISSCPESYKTGDALSPDDTGYASELLDRNTGLAIDSSGNVWLANNWKEIPIQTDPAGDGLVVFIGLATPIKTPLIGTPVSLKPKKPCESRFHSDWPGKHSQRWSEDSSETLGITNPLVE